MYQFKSEADKLISHIKRGELESVEKIVSSLDLETLNKLKSDFGVTPFVQAIWEKNLPMTDCFLRKGGYVNQAIGLAMGRTPLMHAVDTGEKRIVVALLNAKANASIIAPSGETALSIAEKNQNKEIIGLIQTALLPPNPGILSTTFDYLSSFITPAPEPSCTEKLPTSKIKPSTKRSLNSDLFALAEVGSTDNVLEFVKFLTDNVINSTNDAGETALFIATRLNHNGFVEILLKNDKTDVNKAVLGTLETPLMKAVSNNNGYIVACLLVPKIEVEKKNRQGQTVFDLISSNTSEYIQKLLAPYKTSQQSSWGVADALSYACTWVPGYNAFSTKQVEQPQSQVLQSNENSIIDAKPQ